MREIGILDSASPAVRGDELSAFFSGLTAAGVQGGDVCVSYCWANNDREQLSRLAKELVDRKVKVLVAAGGTVSAIAAKSETDKIANPADRIPIVFTAVTDPVGSGLVADLRRPGGNVTGIAGITSKLDPRRLALLQQLKDGPMTIGVLVNPQHPTITRALKDEMNTVGARAGQGKLDVQKANTLEEIKAAFEAFAKNKVDAVLVASDPFFNSQRSQLIALAAEKRLPAMYQWPEFVEAGGLMSYGPSITEAYHEAGIYAGRILNNESPAAMEVKELTRFRLCVNVATAKALALAIPDKLGKDALSLATKAKL